MMNIVGLQPLYINNYVICSKVRTWLVNSATKAVFRFGGIIFVILLTTNMNVVKPLAPTYYKQVFVLAYLNNASLELAETR